MRATLDAPLAPYGASRHHRYGSTRAWRVPHRNGYLVVEIGLRPRWSSIGVDRWHTTDRDPTITRAWFTEHVWTPGDR